MNILGFFMNLKPEILAEVRLYFIVFLILGFSLGFGLAKLLLKNLAKSLEVKKENLALKEEQIKKEHEKSLSIETKYIELLKEVEENDEFWLRKKRLKTGPNIDISKQLSKEFTK